MLAFVRVVFCTTNRGSALDWLKVAADNPQPYEGHFILMYLKTNIWNDPILDQLEFVEVRSRLGFRE